MDDKPIPLDPQPPLCPLGCCNVRTWTLIVSQANIISFSLGILFSIIMVFDVPFGTTLFSILVNSIFLLLNIQLRSGVLERDIAPILLWLQVYVTMFIIDAVSMISILAVWTFTDKDRFDIHKQQFMENAFYYGGIIEVISALWIYSVYLYYDFEKKLLRQNRISGRQII